jgi:hypothetical protein
MQRRRFSAIVVFTILTVFFGGMAIFWLNDNCPDLSPGNCQFMWGVLVVCVLVGFLLVEILLARKKAQGKWQVQLPQEQHFDENEPPLSGWYIWLRSIVWFTLAGLLGGLPLFIQGSFAVTVTGILTGVFLAGLIRGITNRLPPIEKDNQT